MLGVLERLREGSVYELKQAVASSVGNFWSVPHSQLYREAERLERAGLVAGRDEPSAGGRPRRLYSLTRDGRRALGKWRTETDVEQMAELRDLGLLKLFFGADRRSLAKARLVAHRRQLASYEERLAKLGDEVPEGARFTLEAGIGHEREWVRFWQRLTRSRP